MRKATFADAPDLAQLIDVSVRRLGSEYYSADVIERSIERVFGIDSQLIEDGTYYVAVDDDIIVGCGGWSRRATLYGGDQAKHGEDDELEPGVTPARIRAFFIDPDHARKGIGSKLLQVCESAAAAEGFTMAELVATLPGEPLYAARGYQPKDDVPVDLGDGLVLRCIRMAKALV